MVALTDYEITEVMITYGGGFIQQLGRLYRQADNDNQARIKAAWPEYWKQYYDLAVLRQQQNDTGEG